MEKLKNSTLLKVLCYILIPILTATLFFSIVYVSLKNEDVDIITNKEEYLKSEEFSRQYLYSLYQNVNRISRGYTDIENNGVYDKIEDNIYYREYYNSYANNVDTYIKFIIIDEYSNNIFTNIKTNNYLTEGQNFKEKEIFWNYENGTISTNVEKMNQDNAKYLSLPKNISEIFKGYKVYTYIDSSEFNYSNLENLKISLAKLLSSNPELTEAMIPISFIGLSIIAVYLIWSIGHTKKQNGISLNSLDKFPYGLIVILFGIIFFASIIIAENILVYADISFSLLVYIIGIAYITSYISLAVIGVTTIKRLKAKMFIKTLLIYMILSKICDFLKRLGNNIANDADSKNKIIAYYILFIMLSIILGVTFFTGISFILLIVLWVWTLYILLEYYKNLEQIKNALKDIYEGKGDVKLNTNVLKGTLKELGVYVNDISNGFSNAIKESLKSERLKTELITNVSHDIKTPLTSIINYVDLLKQENIKDEKIKEYVNVLDKKSQRLKKLIDDLVEASKASSGNVKLNIEDINLNELLKQVIGEFEDKFDKKKLIIDLNLPEAETKIKADNRYMYRIIENLFSNISKYSLDNTRVYINLINSNNKIKLEIKNVSKERLNISSDELMQRFVRGDKSRYTEGSGLGLSIAKSLTELQNGSFNIEIDGDLFKAILEWNA